MFQFARFASGPYEFGVRILRHDPEGVPPFGNPRIEACVPLPEAYRSLPRPSSPPGAKASTTVPLVAYRALTMALSCSSLSTCLSRFFLEIHSLSSLLKTQRPLQRLRERNSKKTESNSHSSSIIRRKTPDSIFKELASQGDAKIYIRLQIHGRHLENRTAKATQVRLVFE